MADDQLAGRRVLVVEDDYFLAKDMATMLKREGVEVIGPAANVVRAFEALKHKPEAAVLDLRLGDELSLPVAEELGRRGIPFIFSTGSTSDIPAEHQAFAICPKPTNYADVRRTLVKALQSRA